MYTNKYWNYLCLGRKAQIILRVKEEEEEKHKKRFDSYRNPLYRFLEKYGSQKRENSIHINLVVRSLNIY